MAPMVNSASPPTKPLATVAFSHKLDSFLKKNVQYNLILISDNLNLQIEKTIELKSYGLK